MTYKLVSKKTGIEIKTGDIVTDFRGDRWICRGFTPPRHPGSTGRIHVLSDHNDNINTEFYPSVFEAEIVKQTEPQKTMPAVQRHEIVALSIDEARVVKDALRLYLLTYATDDAERIAQELEIEISRLITLLHHKGA